MHQAHSLSEPRSDPPAVQPVVSSPPVVSPMSEEVAAVKRKVLDRDPEFRHYEATGSLAGARGLLDCVVAGDEDETRDPAAAFDLLRWGGEFVRVSSRKSEMRDLPPRLAERGFEIVSGPSFVRTEWGLPLISPKAHYLIARKTALLRPREFSDRFTYQVRLERHDNPGPEDAPGTGRWIVRKEVPTLERILARLRLKAPNLPAATLERRAKKFADQIFPLFLTREAAMLRIIERDCPPEYLHRFPRVIDLEKDDRGYVRCLRTTWLRNGGRPISQIEFAAQSAELLQVLHDRIGIIHLDLRMDNMVITERGVGFIDFGSAVRVNENIHGNAVLSALFGELMQTSQIQRMLDRMSTAGTVTSTVIRDAHRKVDKAIDLFYLAVQISQPTVNPDLRDLVRYEKFGIEAIELSRLTDAILRPPDPNRPRYRTARDVLQEIRRIDADLKSGRFQRPPETNRPASKPKVWIWN